MGAMKNRRFKSGALRPTPGHPPPVERAELPGARSSPNGFGHFGSERHLLTLLNAGIIAGGYSFGRSRAHARAWASRATVRTRRREGQTEAGGPFWRCEPAGGRRPATGGSGLPDLGKRAALNGGGASDQRQFTSTTAPAVSHGGQPDACRRVSSPFTCAARSSRCEDGEEPSKPSVRCERTKVVELGSAGRRPSDSDGTRGSCRRLRARHALPEVRGNKGSAIAARAADEAHAARKRTCALCRRHICFTIFLSLVLSTYLREPSVADGQLPWEVPLRSGSSIVQRPWPRMASSYGLGDREWGGAACADGGRRTGPGGWTPESLDVDRAEAQVHTTSSCTTPRTFGFDGSRLA